jgi:hypothetical protein
MRQSPEAGRPAGIHQKLLLGRKSAEKLQKAFFLMMVEPIALGKVGYAPDLFQAVAFNFGKSRVRCHVIPSFYLPRRPQLKAGENYDKLGSLK